MRVLIISENRCRENLVPWPIGAASVAAAAKRAGHEVATLDLMFADDPQREVERAIGATEPECVAISVRNIDNQDMTDTVFYVDSTRELIDAVMAATDAPVVLGGSGFGIFPLECLEYTGARIGIAGDGESAFVDVLEVLERVGAGGLAQSGIPGLALIDGDRRIFNPCEFSGFGEEAPPDRGSFDLRNYNWKPGAGPPFVANIQSRRGCDMRCIYCTTPCIEGPSLRCRDPRDVADELESLELEHHQEIVVFADANFNNPPEYARELCARIIEKDLSIRWTAIVNPMNFVPDLYALMKKAGCAGVSLGNESMCDGVLDSLGKGFTALDVKRNFEALRAQGFRVFCFLMFGGPGEDRASVEESVRLMDELAPDEVRVSGGIRIFPGCELERIAAREGQIEPGRNLLRPAFYCSEETRDWLHEYLVGICAERPSWNM